MALSYGSSFLASVSDRVEPLLAAAMPEWKLIATDFQDASVAATGRQLSFNYPRITPAGPWGESDQETEVDVEHSTVVNLDTALDKTFWISDTDLSSVNSQIWAEQRFVPALTGAIMTSCWRRVLEQYTAFNTWIGDWDAGDFDIPHTGIHATYDVVAGVSPRDMLTHIGHTAQRTATDALRNGREQGRTLLLHPYLFDQAISTGYGGYRNLTHYIETERFPVGGRWSVMPDGSVALQHDWFPVEIRDSPINSIIDADDDSVAWKCLAGLIMTKSSVIAVARTPVAPDADFVSTRVIRVGDGGLPIRLTMFYDLEKRRYKMRASALFGCSSTYDSSAGRDIPYHRITLRYQP